MTESDLIKHQIKQKVQNWADNCIRGGQVSRNTVAIAIVVLDHLRRKCPVERDDVVSSGGEIKGARAGLGHILEKYGVSEKYLKECTTRQSHQDGQRLFDDLTWGISLCALEEEERDDLLVEIISGFGDKARAWLNRQSLKLDINRHHTPDSWIETILESARNNQSGGVVEQHLVGAKLEKRFTEIEVANNAAHTADKQTDRPGDFEISSIVYHVTASPTRSVIQKCARNAQIGQHPVLLVPRNQVDKARNLADDEKVINEITVAAIEDFIALNIIEMATEENRQFFDILKEIIAIYNRRLIAVETDLSLQIEVK